MSIFWRWIAAAPLAACLSWQVQAFPVDNSFTAEKAYAKAHRQYPQIEIARVLPSPDLRIARNLVYRQLDGRRLHLDLFRPPAAEDEQRPAVLLVHGGGWRSGNRTLQEPLAIYLANSGFATATVEYRLSLEARYPAAVSDVKAALRWLRGNAGEFGVDPQRIAILGASSGAQLATLVGVTPGLEVFADPGTESDTAAESVQAIVNLDGIVSFVTPMALEHENDPRKNPSAAGAWLGGRFEEVPDLWRQASPLEYAGEQSPPTLFINSSYPRFHAGRDQYREKLRAAGVATEVLTIPGTPHPFWLFQPWFDPTAERVTAFLHKTLK